MNKKTKYQKIGNVKLTIGMLLVYVVIQVMLFLYNLDNPIFCIVLILFNVLFVIWCIYVISGLLKGKRVIRKENKHLKKINPYIYFRELPNYFGIGVTTLLMDSTIENHKDIVAVILDLCARKYLDLSKQGDKYVIKVLKGIDDNLLSNEKYILSLILNNNIKGINFEEWFNYCMEDGINLGLYTHMIQKAELDNPILSFQKKVKRNRIIKLIISLILSCFIFLFDFNGIFLFGISYLVLTIIFNIKLFLGEIIKEAKHSRNQNYLNQLNNNLVRTDKGVEELHKLYSFKEFIKDFGYFVNKKPEEVVLWDRYLSYAQVFGLTKEIMDSGYKELIDNSSFQIDSIDNINLYNIEVR